MSSMCLRNGLACINYALHNVSVANGNGRPDLYGFVTTRVILKVIYRMILIK